MRVECPTCKTVIENAPDDHPPRPFCSARCKLLDLGNWFNEVYCVSESIDPLPEAAETAEKQKLS